MYGPLSRYLSIYDQSTYLDQRTLRDGITIRTTHFADQSLFVVRNPTKFVLMLKMFFISAVCLELLINPILIISKRKLPSGHHIC